MAAASPRKPRRTSGRHRKPRHHAQWLRAGAVGFGLAAAIISGQGVASADTDDASSSRGSSASETGGKQGSVSGRPSAGREQSESSASSDGGAGDSADAPAGGNDDDVGSDVVGEDELVDDELDEDELVDDEQEPQAAEDEDDLPSATPTDDSDGSTPRQKPSAAERSTASPDSGVPAPATGESDQAADTPSSHTPANATVDDDSAPDDTKTPGDSAESPADPDTPQDGGELTEQQVRAAVAEWVEKVLKAIGRAPVDGEPATPVSLNEVLQGLWLANRKSRESSEFLEVLGERMLGQSAVSIGWIPVVGTAMYAANFLGNLNALAAAVKRGDSADIRDELRDLGRDLIGMIPIIGAPSAALLYEMEQSAVELASVGAAGSPRMSAAAATAMPPQEQTYNVLARAIERLWPAPGSRFGWMGRWPGTPVNFVGVTNYQTDRTLDAADDQLDGIVASAPPGSAAAWVPDLQSLIGLFFASAVPGYTVSDTLNAMGDFLARVVPPFKLADGAGTLDIISPYKIMGAAVVGAATLLKDMMHGIYDPVQWEIDIIKSTTGATVTASDLNDFSGLMTKVALSVTLGDGGAFSHPERAWDVTLPTWTNAQVNPYTVTTYIAVVAIYKRFKEMARLTTFTTWTTYDSWHYTNGLGMYAAGTFHAVDPDGGSIVFRADGTLGKTYTTEGNALVTINTVGGGFTYTPPALWDPKAQGAAFRHRSTAEDPEERFDWVTVDAYSADGVPYSIRVGIEIINGTNAAPVYTGITNQNTDALGVVKGKLNATDSDGDPIRYYLVESSVNGLTGNSAYTKNGSGNGGVVTLSENGEFTYVSNATAGANQSFQVRINDAHHGNTIVTVTVPNTTSITPGNVNTSTPYVVTGTPPASTNKPGTFVSYTLVGGTTKGTVTSFNPTTGAFTYTSSVGRVLNNDDVITVIATDADGRSVTLRLNVKPSTVTNNPTLTLTTAPTVGTLSGTTQTSTGKLTFSDADGDTPIWTNTTSARGGTVSFAADGTFTYTSNLTVAQRHAVARIGAAGSTFNGVALNAWEDAFTATVSDGFGGTAQITVKVPIYAINSAPTVTSGSNFLGTVGVIKATDPDGDDISTTRTQTPGNSYYTLSNGGALTSGSLSAGTGTVTFPSGGFPVTLRVYDGYYFVNSGVVTGNPAYGQKVLG